MLCVAILVFFLEFISGHQKSPCPDVFKYEDRCPEEDRWYGQVTLTTPNLISGILLRIILDQRAEQLGNWFGEASSEDNINFYIKKWDYVLQPTAEPLTIRFFVKYNTAAAVPRVTAIRLNGGDLCMAGATAATTQPPQLYTSRVKTTEAPAAAQPKSRQPTSSIVGNSNDDFFAGDFSPWTRPLIPIPSFSLDVQGSCGTVKVAARPLTTYGQDTIEGEWPWHAALYRYEGINLQYICAGSLISPSHILTAAHCVTNLKTGVPISPDLFTVYLGKYNLYKVGPSVQDKTVKEITTHPEFNASYFHNDLAVLHLDGAIQISDFVRTVCLWDEDVSLNSVMEKVGTVVGWGFDQHGNITENLMQAKMPIVSTETCILSNRDFSHFTSSKTYCAGFRNGTSVCTGDSGGGMVLPKSNTQGQNSVWQLRGVISLSAKLQNEQLTCDTSNYIVFTDVAKHLDWIRNVIKTYSWKINLC